MERGGVEKVGLLPGGMRFRKSQPESDIRHAEPVVDGDKAHEIERAGEGQRHVLKKNGGILDQRRSLSAEVSLRAFSVRQDQDEDRAVFAVRVRRCGLHDLPET